MILLCKFLNKAKKSPYIVLADELFKAVFAYDLFFKKTLKRFSSASYRIYRTGRKKQNIVIVKGFVKCFNL